MKKIIFTLFVAGISLQMKAQLTNGNFTDEVDERLKNVSKSPINSNILIDRVFPFAKIQVFNQGVRKDTSSYAHFKQSWSELYRASYTKNFNSLEQLEQGLQNKKYRNNIIPIGIINTEFHQTNFGKTSATATVNFNPTTGLFSNKSGKNPFVKKQTTIISPLVSTAKGSQITFKVDALFKLYKKGNRIKTLRLYTNGTSFALINNYNLSTSNFNTNYSSSGVKILRFVITYANNTSKITYAKVQVNLPIATAQRTGVSSALENIDAYNDLLFQGYDETKAYRGRNEYRIYYNDDDKTLDKPLIIIDGFDPEDKRKISPESPNYNQESKSITELMSYDHDNNPNTKNKDLVKELNDFGYDVIIVNHPKYKDGGKDIDGGSDYIQRNAFTLISLIRKLKNMQQGNEEMVVIGPSMGGLISRYALAYMEKKLAENPSNSAHQKNWNHNTRLWVSFDSPHQGANIPIGVQKGLEYFAESLGNEGAKEFVNIQLKQPATKQMLINYYTNNSSLPVGAVGFRDRFQTELDNLGMPNNLRKVSLINGSIMGALNGVSSAKTLEVDGDIDTFIFLPYLPITSIVLTVIANIFADGLLANFYHTINKKNGNEKTFTFDGGIRGSFLWWEWWTTRTNFTSQANAKGSYDIAPGGYFNAQQLVANQSESQDAYFYFFVNVGVGTGATVYDPTHSFIPTKSALAYTGSNVLDEVIGTKDRVCSGETPFDSYFAPKGNEEHIFLTPENVAWLTGEINGNPQGVSTYLPTNVRLVASAGHNDAVCYGQYSTFSTSLGASCVKENISWSVSSNLKIIENNNANIRIGAKYANSAGSGWVKAIVNGTTLTANVEVGKPLSSVMRFNRLESTNFQSNQWNILGTYYNGVLNISRYTWQWQVPSSAIRHSSPNHSYINFSPNVNQNTRIFIRTRASNNCGYSNWYGKWFNVIKNNNPCKDGTRLPCSDATIDY